MKSGIVKSKFILDSTRLNSDYHLSEGVVYERIISNKKHNLLKELSKEIFCGGRSKRIYVQKEEGIPYLGNMSLVSSSPTTNCNYVSKKYWNDSKSFLKEGMILTGRVGQNTVGAYVFANKGLENSLGSDNVIRIILNEIAPKGYVYAFLASKYGYELTRRNISGNAQPFITEDMLSNMPIPNIGSDIQKKVDKLVKEAADNKFQAYIIFEEAKQLIEKELGSEETNSIGIYKCSIKSISKNYNLRIDSPVYINEGVNFFKKTSRKLQTIKELGYTVSRPGIFKRVKVKHSEGIPYIKGGELNKFDPFRTCEYLSKTKTPFLEELRLKENQLLITCAGTVGDTKLISKEYEEKEAVGSQDIIRIEQSSSNVEIEYLYAYLKIKIVVDFVQSLKYGSVIERVEPFHIEKIPVFVLKNSVREVVVEKVKEHRDLLYSAFKKEEEAIALVEKEIEQWEK